MVALKTFTIVTKNILKIRSGALYLDLASTLSLALCLALPPVRHGGRHLPGLVEGVVHVPLLLGLDLHPSLALCLASSPVCQGGGHLPELVGGVVHVPLLLGLDLPLVHPGGGHLPGLDHGGRGQQCWTDWAWVFIAGWCYHWAGAACGETSPRRAPCPDKYWLDVCHT